MMVGASIFHFARGLAARKFFTTSDMLGFVWQQLKFRVGGRELSYGHTTGRDTALSFVAGRPVADIVELGEEIYDELMADRIWAGTRALAQMHLDAGQRVWLVTATPVELALIIARRLGLTGALGTVAESVDGHYTGRLVGEVLHGPAKAHAVRALAATEGLDLRRCTAYSDSVNDVPMLSAVGHGGGRQPGPRPARHRPRPRLADPRLPHGPPRHPHRRAGAARGRRGGRRGGRGPAPLGLAATTGARSSVRGAAEPPATSSTTLSRGRRCGGGRAGGRGCAGSSRGPGRRG